MMLFVNKIKLVKYNNFYNCILCKKLYFINKRGYFIKFFKVIIEKTLLKIVCLKIKKVIKSSKNTIFNYLL